MYHGAQNQRPSVRNTLFLDIPGFTSNLHVRFPDCRLPVCGRCKKNYKTRDMCRTQGEHTDLPWSTVFICITLDHTCTDANNNLKKGTFTTRNMEWMPYCFKNEVNAKTLICAACKTKNYTRKQCRVKSRHRFLPWSTVYVMLSCDNREDPSRYGPSGASSDTRKDGNNPGRSSPLAKSSVKRESSDDDEVEHRATKRRATSDDNDKPIKSLSSENDVHPCEKIDPQWKKDLEKSDDITKVDRSRTFLLEVAVDTCIIKWLDYDRSKAIRGHNYLQDPSGAMHQLSHHRGPASQQAQMYANPPRYFPHPTDGASNSQIFSMDNQQRPFPSQLYMHHAAYPNWQGSSAITGGDHNSSNSASRASAAEDQADHYQQHPYWNAAENYEQQMQSQQAQVNARSWPAGYPQAAALDPSQIAQHAMLAAQEGRTPGGYSSNPYSEQESENGQYNASQHQFHHQY